MGFFKKLGYAFSEKLGLYNKLIGNNINLITNSLEYESSDFIKNWTISCLIHIRATLEMLLPIGEDVQQIEDFKYFSDRIDLLNSEKVFEIFKLLCGFNLFVFLKNKDNLQFLNEINLNRKDFEKKIFDKFYFSEEDKSLYLKLSKLSNNDISNYPLNLWNEVVKKSFEEKEKQIKLPDLLILTTLTLGSYKNIFYPTLINLIKNN